MHQSTAIPIPTRSPLDRARRKAYWRLLPLLILCYVIAYIDRQNVALAKLQMSQALHGFDDAVIGIGSGVFFIGYFLLEIPGTLIVERWSARKWIARIMVTWGIMAALTAAVKTPWQFYTVRFLLGLAEAGFFPGVIVYLTHWFPARDRTRALAYFLIGSPIAMIATPKITNQLLRIGSTETIQGVLVHHPLLMGLYGWQWAYIFWGLPAVALGVVVLFALTDRPRDAKWLSAEEREALENELESERHRLEGVYEEDAPPDANETTSLTNATDAQNAPPILQYRTPQRPRHMTLGMALRHPKALMLAAAYFFIVTGNYGIEFFMPSILQQWYSMKLDHLTWLVMLPPLLAVFGQLFAGWSSDRTRERRLHAALPILIGAVVLLLTPLTRGHLTLTIICFMVAYTATKAYLPGFWALPSLFLTRTAAAGSIGMINSVGNLGGFLGPAVLGVVQTKTGSFVGGIYFLCAAMAVSTTILLLIGIGRREPKESAA